MNRSLLALGLGLLMGCGASPASTNNTPAVSSGGQAAPSTDSNITFRNSSNWVITHLYLSPVEQNTWGPDQLGAEVIRTGGSFTVTGIPCGNYDLKLVDEDRDECIVRNANICAENGGIDIDSNDLLACQAATRTNGAANKSVPR